MANFIVCDGNLVAAKAGPSAIPNVLACDTGWVIKPEPVTDFQDLVRLLQFDPEICAWIIGISLVFFVTGYGAGMMLRTLNRG